MAKGKNSGKKNPETAPLGHNQMSEADRGFLLLRSVAFLEAEGAFIATHTANIRNERKKMIGFGFDKVEIDHALWARKNPDKVDERLRLQVTVNRYLCVGGQFEMFGKSEKLTKVEQARKEGVAAGALGETINTTKWHAGSPEGQAYHDGWHESQSKIMAGIKPIEPTKTPLEEFDDATSSTPSQRNRRPGAGMPSAKGARGGKAADPANDDGPEDGAETTH